MLTERQQEIYDFVVATPTSTATRRRSGRSARRSASPRRRPCTRISPTSSAPGYLRRDPTKPRALELVGRERAGRRRRLAEAGGRGSHLPLVGEIAAGGPLLAEQNIEEHLAVPEPLSRGGEEFLLRVKGESMVDAGILDGDYVVVRRQQDAKNGDIVVALAGAGRGGGRGDGQALLPGGRAHPASAGERRAWSRSIPSTYRSSAR